MATILVVDDRSANREALVTLLEYKGHRMLEASDGLRAVLGLEEDVPAHTTLLEFSKRTLSPQLLDTLVGQVLELLQENGLVVKEVAIDSTGVETSSASAHFVSRSKRKRGGYVKLSFAVACTSIVLVSLAISIGPCTTSGKYTVIGWKPSSIIALAKSSVETPVPSSR